MLAMTLSNLVGVLALLLGLGVWPDLNAATLGLNTRGAFCLTGAGVYLLATNLYVLWRTDFLANVGSVSWDTRLMLYVSVTVGSLAGMALVLLGLVGLVLFMILRGIAGNMGGGPPPPAEGQVVYLSTMHYVGEQTPGRRGRRNQRW
jgi:hypothetical protein